MRCGINLVVVLAILLTFTQALAVVFSGQYGPASELGAGGTVLIVVQLLVAGLFVIYADEILQKGYSWGSGISFFTTLTVTQQVMWRGFSFSSEDFGRGNEFIGAVPALFQLLWNRKSFNQALMEAFYRKHLPNLFEFYGVALIFGIMVYLQSFRYDISIKSTRVKSPAQNYPIRLLYTGNLPVLFIAALTSNLFRISQALYRQFPENLLVRLLGTWTLKAGTSHVVAVSGLAYYLQPPFSLVEALWDPIKTVIYAGMVVFGCTVFARVWTEHSGGSPRDVAKTFKNQSIVILGMRDASVIKELKKHIPVAAGIGGAVIGGLSVASDLLGALGNGTAIVVGILAIYNYFEILAQEGGLPNSFMPGQ